MNRFIQKKYFLLYVIILALTATFGYFAYNNYKVSQLATCLYEKGVVFYGASWCKHCDKQKQIFGKASQHVPYFECSTVETLPQKKECFEKNIKKYPTWVFPEGQIVEGGLSLKSLDEKSGCQIGI